jgi:hypothetical protein
VLTANCHVTPRVYMHRFKCLIFIIPCKFTWMTTLEERLLLTVFPLFIFYTLPVQSKLFILTILLIYILLSHYLALENYKLFILIVKDRPLPQFFPYMKMLHRPMMAAISGRNMSYWMWWIYEYTITYTAVLFGELINLHLLINTTR